MLRNSFHSALLATALVLPVMATQSAGAQSQQGQDQKLSANCQNLIDRLADSDGQVMINNQPRNVETLQRLAEANKDSDCRVVVENMEITAQDGQQQQGQQQQASEQDSVSKRLSIEERAVLEGMAIVTVPPAKVAIDQPGADVEVRPSQPRVSVDEQPATIRIRQPQSTVRVEMTPPKITIDQPAPEITIIMPPPGVDVASAEPQVRVNMPKPKVQVTQGEPSVQLDLEAAGRGNADGQSSRQARSSDVSQKDIADVMYNAGQPTVRLIQQGESQPRVSISRAAPNVEFQPSDPKIEISSTGEPQVQVRQTGQPKVTLQRSSDQQSGSQQSGSQQASSQQASSQQSGSQQSGSQQSDSQQSDSQQSDSQQSGSGQQLKQQAMQALGVAQQAVNSDPLDFNPAA